MLSSGVFREKAKGIIVLVSTVLRAINLDCNILFYHHFMISKEVLNKISFKYTIVQSLLYRPR